MKTRRNVLAEIAAVLGFLLGIYVFSYLVWINYTATGNYFTGIFDHHGIHLAMSFAMHPSPPFLKFIFWPLIWMDYECGRLAISFG